VSIGNLDHFGIGIIVNYVVIKLLGNILINLLFRVVFLDHPESYTGLRLSSGLILSVRSICTPSDKNFLCVIKDHPSFAPTAANSSVHLNPNVLFAEPADRGPGSKTMPGPGG
jgi:hypothetical protein